MRTYVLQVLIAFDQLINTLLGGWADETLSARAHREMPLLEKVIDCIFFFQPQHCYKSYLAEKARLQSPVEERP